MGVSLKRSTSASMPIIDCGSYPIGWLNLCSSSKWTTDRQPYRRTKWRRSVRCKLQSSGKGSIASSPWSCARCPRPLPGPCPAKPGRRWSQTGRGQIPPGRDWSRSGRGQSQPGKGSDSLDNEKRQREKNAIPKNKELRRMYQK